VPPLNFEDQGFSMSLPPESAKKTAQNSSKIGV